MFFSRTKFDVPMFSWLDDNYLGVCVLRILRSEYKDIIILLLQLNKCNLPTKFRYYCYHYFLSNCRLNIVHFILPIMK